ncbi:MAG: hypothetical protein AMXMBFR7_24360 [Planctomycetota bacterium]
MKRDWKHILLRSGDPFIWLTGGALAASLLLVIGMIALIFVSGLGYFWPHALTKFDLGDGKQVLGALMEREEIPNPDNPEHAVRHRIKVKQGNRDLYGMDFLWIDEDQIKSRELPGDAVQVERMEWGHFYGYVKEVKDGGKPVATGAEAFAKIQALLPEAERIREEIRSLERDSVGEINYYQNQVRLKLKKLHLDGVDTGPEVDALTQEMDSWQQKYTDLTKRIAELKAKQTYSVIFTAPAGALASGEREKTMALAEILRVDKPNHMSVLEKCGYYLAKVWEFVAADPRESNTEGGVFPAIFGTVMMVMIMSVLVTPLGVLAAFYLREYAKQGTMVSIVRIAVNNLAGVPSIVFGVFGVGFFIYFMGAGTDKALFPEMLPTPTFGTGGILWASLTLSLLTVPVVIVATEEGLAAIPPSMREGSLALGATKFETTVRVVLPAVMPSILTGLILAMARAAGEVAPLMITGVVKLAPSLPLDGYFPYVHLERKFMHLGFHIYDVGFQSPNVDAARPMVFTTTLLLLGIIVLLNIGAIFIRNRLRKKFSAATAAI